MLNFIARNLAWLGLWLLAPKEIAAMEEPQGVIVMLPVSGQLEMVGTGSEQRDQQAARIPHKLSSILFLYPGRTRMQGRGQSARETAKTVLGYPCAESYRFVPGFSMPFSRHAKKANSGPKTVSAS
jgi:hypothetical protein